MKSFIRVISRPATVFAMIMAFAASVHAADGPPGTDVIASANATVVTPVAINQFVGLSFGTFSASPTVAGTIDSSGNATGGVSKVTAGTPATFNTTGVVEYNYTIVGDPSVTLTDTSGDVMTAALTYPTGQRTLNGSGTDSFTVAGVLTVSAGQPANSYSGNYNVSVHY